MKNQKATQPFVSQKAAPFLSAVKRTSRDMAFGAVFLLAVTAYFPQLHLSWNFTAGNLPSDLVVADNATSAMSDTITNANTPEKKKHNKKVGQ